jgi:hypothetical protein
MASLRDYLKDLNEPKLDANDLWNFAVFTIAPSLPALTLKIAKVLTQMNVTSTLSDIKTSRAFPSTGDQSIPRHDTIFRKFWKFI